ncbi:MAG: hypothetical protein ACHQAX_09965 [Gammaproteobacteria bacterium]
MLTVLQNTPKGSSISFQPTDSLNKVIAALQNTPHPIISKDRETDISADETAIIIEHEACIGKKSHLQIKHVVTKHQAQCMLILLENKDNYLAIHVNNPYVSLELPSLIQKFSSFENIQVTLIGGSLAEELTSQVNLLRIITDLLMLSRRYPIEIKAQYLLKYNAFKDEGKPAFIRDNMLFFASIAYQNIYNEVLNLEEFKNHTLSEFSTHHCTESVAQFQGQALTEILLRSKAVASKEEAEYIERKMPQIIRIFPTKDVFKKALHGMFTVENYNAFIAPFEESKLFPIAELQHYAINLRTGLIHHISMLTSTPHEALRTIYHRHQTYENTPYHLVFENDHYIPPTLPRKILTLIKTISPMIQKGLATDELKAEIRKVCPDIKVDSPYDLNEFCSAIKGLSYEKREPLKQPEKPVTFAYTASISNKEVCDHLIEMSAEDKAAVKRLCV